MYLKNRIFDNIFQASVNKFSWMLVCEHYTFMNTNYG